MSGCPPGNTYQKFTMLQLGGAQLLFIKFFGLTSVEHSSTPSCKKGPSLGYFGMKISPALLILSCIRTSIGRAFEPQDFGTI